MEVNWLLVENTLINLDKMVFIDYMLCEEKEPKAKLVFYPVGGYDSYEVEVRKLSDREKAMLFKRLAEDGIKRLDILLEEIRIMAGRKEK